MPLEDFRNKIKVLYSFNIEKEAIDIINANQSILIKLLQNQLSAGKDSKGDNVTVFGRDYYSDRTVFEKDFHGVGLGKVTDYITNYMSGQFYAEMFVKTEGQNFEIESSVPYFEKIILQSGEVIMELNEENTRYFSQEILIPELQLRFSNLWNGV